MTGRVDPARWRRITRLVIGLADDLAAARLRLAPLVREVVHELVPMLPTEVGLQVLHAAGRLAYALGLPEDDRPLELVLGIGVVAETEARVVVVVREGRAIHIPLDLAQLDAMLARVKRTNWASEIELFLIDPARVLALEALLRTGLDAAQAAELLLRAILAAEGSGAAADRDQSARWQS